MRTLDWILQTNKLDQKITGFRLRKARVVHQSNNQHKNRWVQRLLDLTSDLAKKAHGSGDMEAKRHHFAVMEELDRHLR